MGLLNDEPDPVSLAQREHNLTLPHVFPLGSLVEINDTIPHMKGVRLYVICHERYIMDNVPTYRLSAHSQTAQDVYLDSLRDHLSGSGETFSSVRNRTVLTLEGSFLTLIQLPGT